MRGTLRIKYCRHCGRIIPLESSECPYCDKVVIREHQQKECPFCGEAVKAKAIKCKHCGEFLDGRGARPPDRQQVLHIEKAIIAAPGPQGEVQLLRPDGRPLSVNELGPGARGQLPQAPPPAKALPPGEVEQEQVASELPVKAPPAPPARVPVVRPVPMPLEAPAVPAPVSVRPVREVVAAPEEAIAEPPPVELECPICKRTVFHGDHYCENCGRDLTLAKGELSIKPPPEPHGLTDHALILSTAAPVGALLPSPYSGLIAAAGASLGVWCTVRIVASGGKLKGVKPALWAAALGLFWLVVIYIAKGF